MPIPVNLLLPNGQLQQAPIMADTLNEFGLKEPAGVYTVARTYQRTKTVLFEAHLDRLEESARLENITLNLDRMSLRKGLSVFLEKCGFQESRFRITIPKTQPGPIWLAAEPLQPAPAELKRDGVMVATCEIERPNPKAKSNAWVSLRNEATRCMSEEAYEAIILNRDGYLMEGFRSNFYAILGETLFTADSGILHGIARRIVTEITPGLIGIKFAPIHRDQVLQIQEAFLSSSSRGIVPVVQIDHTRIADGNPGATTHQLCAAYDRWVEKNMLPIA